MSDTYEVCIRGAFAADDGLMVALDPPGWDHTQEGWLSVDGVRIDDDEVGAVRLADDARRDFDREGFSGTVGRPGSQTDEAREILARVAAKIGAREAARALRAIPSAARAEASRTNGQRGGRRRLVYEDKREWTTARIYASARGWTVEVDRRIAGERTGERYALDYSADIPAGQDLRAAWNEGTTYADVLLDRYRSGRCLRAGFVVA